MTLGRRMIMTTATSKTAPADTTTMGVILRDAGLSIKEFRRLLIHKRKS